MERSNASPICAISETSQEVSCPRVSIRSCVERPHRVSSVTGTASTSRACIERHHPLALDGLLAVRLADARGRLPENGGDLLARPLGVRPEIAFLPIVVLAWGPGLGSRPGSRSRPACAHRPPHHAVPTKPLQISDLGGHNGTATRSGRSNGQHGLASDRPLAWVGLSMWMLSVFG